MLQPLPLGYQDYSTTNTMCVSSCRSHQEHTASQIPTCNCEGILGSAHEEPCAPKLDSINLTVQHLPATSLLKVLGTTFEKELLVLIISRCEIWLLQRTLPKVSSKVLASPDWLSSDVLVFWCHFCLRILIHILWEFSLGTLEMQPAAVCGTTLACAVLHNTYLPFLYHWR